MNLFAPAVRLDDSSIVCLSLGAGFKNSYKGLQVPVELDLLRIYQGAVKVKNHCKG